MKYSFIAFFIIIGLLKVNGQDCEKDYDSFLDKIKNNEEFKFSPAVLVGEYNSLYDCNIDEVSRNYIENHLGNFYKLDSIHCEYKKSGDTTLAVSVRELKPDKRDTSLYKLYDNLENIIAGASKKNFATHCNSKKIEITKGGYTGENLKKKTEVTNPVENTNEPDAQAEDGKKPDTANNTKKEPSTPAENVQEPDKPAEGEKDPDSSAKDTTESDVPVEKEKVEESCFDAINADMTFNDLLMEDPKLYLTADKKHFLEFCFVTKGSFNLGITSNQYTEVLMEAGEKAFELNVQDEVAKSESRYIEIKEPFHISKYELSREQFNLIMNGTSTPDPLAMTNVSEEELKILLEKLNHTYPALNFDIPDEVEWEFAARGASENFYISSNDYFEIDDKVIVDDSLGVKNIIQENLLCSWVNACNMIGNAKEICHANHDYYTSEYNKNSPYVARGGSYLEDRFSARTTSRHLRTNIRSEDIGIRLIIKRKNK